MTWWYNKFGFDNTDTHTHNKTILIEKSGSNDNNNNRKVRECHNHNLQPTPDNKSKRKRTKINTCKIFFFFLFSAYKNVKSFYTGKIAKKKKLFVDGIYAPLFYCLWHMRNQFTVYSGLQPYPSYRAQPLLYATGKMSLNWGLDCSSVCSMHVSSEFWTRNRMNNEIWIKKINTGNHEFFFLENLILVFGIMTSHLTSSVQLIDCRPDGHTLPPPPREFCRHTLS